MERREREFVVVVAGKEVVRARFSATDAETVELCKGLNCAHWPSQTVGNIHDVADAEPMVSFREFL